jgi:hypothetical protein
MKKSFCTNLNLKFSFLMFFVSSTVILFFSALILFINIYTSNLKIEKNLEKTINFAASALPAAL